MSSHKPHGVNPTFDRITKRDKKSGPLSDCIHSDVLVLCCVFVFVLYIYFTRDIMFIVYRGDSLTLGFLYLLGSGAYTL